MRTSTPTTETERAAWRREWDYAGHESNRAFRLLDDVDELTARLAAAEREYDEIAASSRAAHLKLADATRFCTGEWPCEASTSAASFERENEALRERLAAAEADRDAGIRAEVDAIKEAHESLSGIGVHVLQAQLKEARERLAAVERERDEWKALCAREASQATENLVGRIDNALGWNQVLDERDAAQARLREVEGFVRQLHRWRREDDHTPHQGDCDRCTFQCLLAPADRMSIGECLTSGGHHIHRPTGICDQCGHAPMGAGGEEGK